MTRQLILIDWDDERELSTLPLQRPDCVSPRMNLVDALELLRTGGTLMAFVCARPEIANKELENDLPIPVEAGFMGIITLEDVMESILQGRIHDESDIKDSNRAIATLHRWAALKLQNFVRKKRNVRMAKEEADQLRRITGSTHSTSTSNHNQQQQQQQSYYQNHNYQHHYNHNHFTNNNNHHSMLGKTVLLSPIQDVGSNSFDNDFHEEEGEGGEKERNVDEEYGTESNHQSYHPSPTSPLLPSLNGTKKPNYSFF